MKINIASKEIIHFIGIGGIGMSGLAQIMKNMGFAIQGSDLNSNVNVERLIKTKRMSVCGKRRSFWRHNHAGGKLLRAQFCSEGELDHISNPALWWVNRSGRIQTIGISRKYLTGPFGAELVYTKVAGIRVGGLPEADFLRLGLRADIEGAGFVHRPFVARQWCLVQYGMVKGNEAAQGIAVAQTMTGVGHIT